MKWHLYSYSTGSKRSMLMLEDPERNVVTIIPEICYVIELPNGTKIAARCLKVGEQHAVFCTVDLYNQGSYILQLTEKEPEEPQSWEGKPIEINHTSEQIASLHVLNRIPLS